MKYVKVRKNNFIFCFCISLFISLIISSLTISAYKNIKNLQNILLEPVVYAGNDDMLELSEVSIVEEYIIPVIVDIPKEIELEPVSLEAIGKFNLTAYCPCSICCENFTSSVEGKTTAIEVGAYEGITVAVDPKKIPYGTKLYIDGVGVCIATDCGGAIKGNKIDVYFESHLDARKFGTFGGKAQDVFVIKEN